MTLRLTFATRIGLIVVLGFLGAWIASLVLFYLSRAQEDTRVQPLPEQIAAIVNLVERAPSGQQASILRAVNSDALSVHIEPGIHLQRAPRRFLLQLATKSAQQYMDALGGRPLSIRRSRDHSRARPRVLEIRVGLRTNQTLVADAHGMYLATFFGLPVGFSAGLIGTLVALLALYLLHRETRPLARIAAAVDRIDLSGPPVPLPRPTNSAPEIQAFVDAFNRLQNRLAQLMKARLAMLGGISHDVRTFATRLRLRLEEMPQSERRERAVADIDDMIRLLDDALLASRAGADELAGELVELAEVVCADAADRCAQAAAVSLRISGDAQSATVLGDRLALKRIVANLVDNALKYGKRAEIALVREASELVLMVDDDGPGVEPSRRDIVLEPFVRLEGSRNRQTGGAGLGLAIVRNLVEAMGGSVAVGDAPIGGARFTVRLPLFEPH